MKKLLLFIAITSVTLNSCEFKDIDLEKEVFLNAGVKGDRLHYQNYIGLDLRISNEEHIKFNLLDRIPLPDNSVDRFHSEDTYEHIEYEKLKDVINEVFRVLKVGGRLRLALPDYRCDILRRRTKKDSNGNLLFDPGGGGAFINGKVVKGGHVWFPVIENVKELLHKTLFSEFGEIVFYHFYDEDNTPICREIDYSLGWVKRTPDHDLRVMNPYRPMSIVVDCIKKENI